MKRRFATSRANNVVLASMGMFGSVRAISMFFSLVRNKLIAVVVGPTGVGLVILYNSTLDIVSSLSRLNVDQSAMRDLASGSHAEEAEIATVVNTWTFGLGIAAMILVCVLSPLLSIWSFGNMSHWWNFCLLSFVPAAYTINSGRQSIMQGLGFLRKLAAIGLVTAIGGIITTIPLVLILRENSIFWIILSYAVWCFGATMYFRIPFPRVAMPLREIWRRGSSFVRFGAWITVGLTMGYLFNYLFVIFMNTYADTTELGIFQGGFTIINTYIGLVFSGMWVEFYPKLTAVSHSCKRVSTLTTHRMTTVALIVLPIASLFIACDELIVRIIYSEAFLDMLPYITVGICGVILRATSWCMAHAILARGDGLTYAVVETLSGVAYLTFSILGFVYLGFYGLGLAYILWYAMYWMITYYVYRVRYGYQLKGNILGLVVFVFAYCVVAAVARLQIGWWLPLVMGITVVPFSLRRLLQVGK